MSTCVEITVEELKAVLSSDVRTSGTLPEDFKLDELSVEVLDALKAEYLDLKLNQNDTFAPLGTLLRKFASKWNDELLGKNEDPEEPSVDSVTFSHTSGPVALGADETFKYTIAVEGTGVALLEIDINTVNASDPWRPRIQFWLSADVNDPYAGDGAEFEQYGITVDYADNTWTIDFGETATPAMIESGNISIHTAVTDIDKNLLWNDMMNPLPEGKVTVNITREEEVENE